MTTFGKELLPIRTGDANSQSVDCAIHCPRQWKVKKYNKIVGHAHMATRKCLYQIPPKTLLGLRRTYYSPREKSQKHACIYSLTLNYSSVFHVLKYRVQNPTSSG